MEKCAIVAMADNLAIGKDNDLLWHISEDLKYFKQVTLGSPVIMGYKTYLSIGRPLPKRKNIVVSKYPIPDAPSRLVLVKTLDDAFKEAALPYAASDDKEAVVPEKCFIIGGGKTYERSLDQIEKLYVTHVHTVIDEADTFFPSLNPEQWKKTWSSEKKEDPETGYSFEFCLYERA